MAQAQHARLNLARLVRACAALPDASTLPAQVQRLSALCTAMMTLHSDGSSAAMDSAQLPSSAGKRSADGRSADNNKRQRVGTREPRPAIGAGSGGVPSQSTERPWTGEQCHERWNNHIDPGINSEPWTHEDDMKLIEAHSRIGNKWTELGAIYTANPRVLLNSTH